MRRMRSNPPSLPRSRGRSAIPSEARERRVGAGASTSDPHAIAPLAPTVAVSLRSAAPPPPLRGGGKEEDVAALMRGIGERARIASAALKSASSATKESALAAAARLLRERGETILAANRRDVAEARAAGMRESFVDRLTMTNAGIEAMARGLSEIAALPDPVGEIIAEWQRPNGLAIQRVRVPLGVIGIIYESRPNVTADAAGLCLKAGNAAILRGGSESFH